MRVCLITLGCPKNEVDSDRMAASLAASGHVLVEGHEDADAVVLNTCGFIREAVEESIEAALEFARWKAASPGRTLVVAGCMPSRYGSELADALPEVDAFVPVAEEGGVAAVLAQRGGRPARASAADADAPHGRTRPGPSAYLMVSDGCSRRCTYCTIPAIRGPYRSREPAAVLAEARALCAAGARELVLVGQDTSGYGRDLGGAASLASLVRELAATEGLEWLRVMYAQPDGITDELLDAMASSERICSYLDIPLQHASRDVLRRMGRAGDADAHLALIERVRAALPGVALRTSLIAGFPGETENDLRQLEGFVEAARFDYAGVFAYSPEEGTPAERMRPRVRAAERAERANRVRAVADAIGMASAAERVGDLLDVLVEGVEEDGDVVGRWRGQAPEVDGVVSLDGAVASGSIVRARVVDALGYDLIGELESGGCSR